MDRVTLERTRAELIARHGAWTASNIDLGHGVFTMAPGLVGMAEARVSRVVQLAVDYAGPLSGKRILDLGCYEGGFAVEFARLGAEVVALDSRQAHVRKAQFAADALGLDGLTVLQGDVRSLAGEVTGSFDVVLCLGVLYHLPGQDALHLLRSLAGLCRGLAIIETQVALRPTRSFTHEGRTYHGRPYPEDTRQPGASVGNAESLWLTKPSLLNALADVGFASVCECLNPIIPALAEYRDHTILIAARGPDLPLSSTSDERWPEKLRRLAAPSQGIRYAALERWLRRRGSGIARCFVKSPSGDNDA